MRLFGLEISRSKSASPVTDLTPLSGGWFPVVREPFAGAWQRNQEIRAPSIHANPAVYSCETLIATDVAKCRPRLMEKDEDGIWSEVSVAAFSPVLKKPNRYQNRIQFFEQWIVSKLSHGNTFVLKERDGRGVVTALYILNPTRVTPLVTPAGDVYYKLASDNLAGLEDANGVVVPASEIMHDVMVPLFHPLCGVSPLMAAALAATQGLSMQTAMEKLFRNGVQPGGILTAPTALSDPDAERYKKYFEEKFTGANAGRVAVLGGGLKFEAMTMKAIDAQLIEQLKWTATVVCSCYHVPAYKVGAGDPPPYQNIEATEQQYYSQCLQKFFECIELLLDEGLGLTTVKNHEYGVEFDLDDLMRMDTATLVDTEVKAIKGLKKINEGRKRLNLPPIEGGDTVYLQEQDHAIAALYRRDQSEDPFKTFSGKGQVAAQPENDLTPSDAASKFIRLDADIQRMFRFGSPIKKAA